ncbi:MAG: hypothetical protein AAFY98_04715 [Verrucomicrobiota bacterium]
MKMKRRLEFVTFQVTNLNLMKQSTLFLRVSAVLWIFWGIVHLLAGIIVLTGDTTAGFQGIADGVPAEVLEMDYPPAVGGVLNQHAWNLAWGGLVTIIGAFFIWRENMTAIWVTAMIGGLLDVGYFLFIDLGGFNRFVPGTVMTIVSSLAIILSFTVWFKARRA